MQLCYAKIMHSNWLKIYVRLGTSKSECFISVQNSYAKFKIVHYSKAMLMTSILLNFVFFTFFLHFIAFLYYQKRLNCNSFIAWKSFPQFFSKFFLRKHIFKTGYLERDDSVFNSKVMSFKLSIKSPNILADCAMKIYHKSCQKSPKLVTRLHLQRLERIWGSNMVFT